jgi:hypothetical protein
LTSKNGEARVAWLAFHIPDCTECAYANRLKDVEARVASAMGRSDAFDRGEDLSKLPGFREAFAAQMASAVRSGLIDRAMAVWMERMARERAGRPWPGRSE